MDRKNALDLVLLCGSPGSGKSSFYWKSLKPLGYERVNQDILKTVWLFHKWSLRTSRPARNAVSLTLTLSVFQQRDKCVTMASAYISESKAVAIGECGRFRRSISIIADPHTRLQITRMPILILEQCGLSSRKNSRFPSDACT